VNDRGHNTEIDQIRESSYMGKITSTSNNKYVNKTDFASNNTSYSTDNTYKNTGGFSHFFEGYFTVDEAYSLYDELNEDGLYDGDLLSIALELMFYNENYQTGMQF
jgi:hypothetical protein